MSDVTYGRYYPVAVAGGLLSMGDAHFAQGDGELDGTAIEVSVLMYILR